ncbi:MAG: 6-phosphofructokinase [Eubacterium aggregans]
MRIGILTSGGDAPGMNAAIRAVVRTAIYHKIDVYGINRGYAGLLDKDITPMNVYSVADILHKGGTILRTSRSEFFPTEAGQKRAAEVLREFGIDHLIVIGGDGSLNGALCLKRLGVSVVGIPGTIDNDFGASDFTVGFDTAVTTAIDAIGKIRDTTFSHNRINVVQVMGRTCGDIALYAGFSVGAEALIVPEIPTDLEEICDRLLVGKDRGKIHSIVMLAEGCGGYRDYCKKIEELTQVTTKGTNLGYIQRGGAPSHFDRNLASYMGYKAVESIVNGQTGNVVVQRKGEYLMVPLEEALKTPKKFNEELYHISKILSI